MYIHTHIHIAQRRGLARHRAGPEPARRCNSKNDNNSNIDNNNDNDINIIVNSIISNDNNV